MDKQVKQSIIATVLEDEIPYKQPYINWHQAGQVIKKHKWIWLSIFIACTLLIGLGKGLTSTSVVASREDLYQTTATLYLSPAGKDLPTDATSATNIENVIQLLKSNSVMESLAQKLGYENPKELKEKLTISNPSKTSMINLKAVTNSADLSYQLVQEPINNLKAVSTDLFPYTTITEVVSPQKATTPIKSTATGVMKALLKYFIAGAALGIGIDLIIIAILLIRHKSFSDAQEVNYVLNLPVDATGDSDLDKQAIDTLRALIMCESKANIIALTGSKPSKLAQGIQASFNQANREIVIFDSNESAQAAGYSSMSDYFSSADFENAVNTAKANNELLLIDLQGEISKAVLLPVCTHADLAIHFIRKHEDTRKEVAECQNNIDESGIPTRIFLSNK